jgi:predicted GIY-YIG superfamily endonuclease
MITLQQLMEQGLLQIPEPDLSFTVDEASQWLTKLTELGGVYVFRQGEKVLYIGRSTNLKVRLRLHLAGQSEVGEYLQSGLSATLDIYFIDNIAYQDMTETYMIYQFNPYFNKDKVVREKPKEARIIEAIKLYKTCRYKQTELMKMLNLSKKVMEYNLAKHGLTKEYLIAERSKLIREMYSNGKSISAISKYFNISRNITSKAVHGRA